MTVDYKMEKLSNYSRQISYNADLALEEVLSKYVCKALNIETEGKSISQLAYEARQHKGRLYCATYRRYEDNRQITTWYVDNKPILVTYRKNDFVGDFWTLEQAYHCVTPEDDAWKEMFRD